MAEKTTFIMLDRNILLWRWWGDDKTFKIFVYLIMKANIKPHDFQGITIQRGQLFTSLPTIAAETKSSVQRVRTALNHLKATGEITDEAYPFGRLITVLSFDKYQGKVTGKSTGNQQATNRRPTGNQQQSNNNKKDTNVSKNENKPAPATPDGGGRAEWEIRLNVPEKFVGRFDDEASWLSFWNNEGWDPH